MANTTTVIPTITPSVQPVSLAYALTYKGTVQRTITDDVRNDYVVLHKDVGNSYTNGELHKVKLSTVLGSSDVTHTPGFVNLGYFNSAKDAISSLSSNETILKEQNVNSVVRAYYPNSYNSSYYDSFTCLISSDNSAFYYHLFIGREEFKSMSYFGSTGLSGGQWYKVGGDTMKWDATDNRYNFLDFRDDLKTISPDIFSGNLNYLTPDSIPYASTLAAGLMSIADYKLIRNEIPSTISACIANINSVSNTVTKLEGTVNNTVLPTINSWSSVIGTTSPIIGYLYKGNVSQSNNYLITNSQYPFVANLQTYSNLSNTYNKLFSAADYSYITTTTLPHLKSGNLSATYNQLLSKTEHTFLNNLTSNSDSNYKLLSYDDWQFLQSLKKNLDLTLS